MHRCLQSLHYGSSNVLKHISPTETTVLSSIKPAIDDVNFNFWQKSISQMKLSIVDRVRLDLLSREKAFVGTKETISVNKNGAQKKETDRHVMSLGSIERRLALLQNLENHVQDKSQTKLNFSAAKKRKEPSDDTNV